MSTSCHLRVKVIKLLKLCEISVKYSRVLKRPWQAFQPSPIFVSKCALVVHKHPGLHENIMEGWKIFNKDQRSSLYLQSAMKKSCFSALVPVSNDGFSREYYRGKNHCTIDLLFDWFGISCMTADNFCFYLQNRLIQNSQTGGQRYSVTSPL